MNVLLIDDDEELLALLQNYLEREGLEIAVRYDGESGASAALSDHYDLVVLDIMLPGHSGLDVLRNIRQYSKIPVLMLTAKGDDIDRILGLELGADDYVQKPCTPRELLARIRAILRRSSPRQEDDARITIGSLTIHPESRMAVWGRRPLELTSTEFSVLTVLARHAGQVVSKTVLSHEALGRPLERFDRSIDVHVSSLRQKLGTLRDGRSCILTIRGQGYQLARE